MKNFLILAAILLFAQSGCGSSVKSGDTGNLASNQVGGKATQEEGIVGSAGEPIYLELELIHGPRDAHGIQSSLLLNPRIQDCLRQTPEVKDRAFSLPIEGQFTQKGNVTKAKVSSQNSALTICIETGIKKINFGKGKAGPFKLRIFRPEFDKNTDKKPEGILLDLNLIKKWE